MSTYTKSTDFLAKDSLPLNNAGKYVKGSEIDTEFDAIETADADNMKKSAMGTGVETFLGTPSSANLAAAVTGETGTGALVFATSPTLVTPALGTPASGTLTNCTGLPQAAVVGLTTADSPQFAGVNVGAASDTTITRASAGIIAVEGNNVVTENKCSIASGKVLTVSNTITLTGTDSTSYNLDNVSGTLFAINHGGAATTGALTVFSGYSMPKRFSITFVGISSDSTGRVEVKLGDAGGVESSGYINSSSFFSSTSVALATAGTDAFRITDDTSTSLADTDVWHGTVVFSQRDTSGLGWYMSGSLINADGTKKFVVDGFKGLSAALTTITISITSGLFDAGNFIIYND